MIVVKILWDIIEETDITLLVLPSIQRHYNHESILQSFRESIHAIKCKFLIVLVENPPCDLILYEDMYDKEFMVLKDLSYINDPSFLEHHNPSIAYLLQNNKDILKNHLFTKIIINTLQCEETLLEQIKSLNVPTHYGLCVFQEIITAKIFLKEHPYFIHGKTTIECDYENAYHFYCSDDGVVCHDSFNDIIYGIQGVPIFVGTFTFYDEKVKHRWDTYFNNKVCIYDLDAFESLKPIKNYRISKDIPNLMKLFYTQNSDILTISTKTNE